MKKLVLTISLLAGATAAYSQGVINWSDYIQGTFSITIWSPQSGPASAPTTFGNTAGDLPPGTAKVGAGGYTGTPLSGTGYEVGLYVGSSPTAVQLAITSGTPIATDSFAAGSGGWDFSGSLTATDPSSAAGTSVYTGLAAWSTTTGSPGSYAAAVLDGDLFGSVVSAAPTSLGGADLPNPPITPGNLTGSGLTDFALGGVPEPSTIALGVMGASAFLMRLRRKQ